MGESYVGPAFVIEGDRLWPVEVETSAYMMGTELGWAGRLTGPPPEVTVKGELRLRFPDGREGRAVVSRLETAGRRATFVGVGMPPFGISRAANTRSTGPPALG